MRLSTAGRPDLNEWLTRHARTAQAKRTAQVFVWTEEGDTAVLAYFTLSAHEVVAADLPRRLARGMPERIPAVLLGKPALDRCLRGQGLGGQLLFDAYQRVLAAHPFAWRALDAPDPHARRHPSRCRFPVIINQNAESAYRPNYDDRSVDLCKLI